VIVNAARVHDETARQLIDAGIPVLMEKPLALTREAAEGLYICAESAGVYLMPVLTFRRCSYLQHFAQTVAALPEPVVSARLEWCDPRAETRYGDDKDYDPGVSVATDVMPHVWSILAITLDAAGAEPRVHSCKIARGGRRATFDIRFSDVDCEVLIEREAPARCRRLWITTASGSGAAIDFTIEPGTISVNTCRFSGDDDWAHSARPIRRHLEVFLAALNTPWLQLGPDEKRAGLASVKFAEVADCLLKQAQRKWLAGCSLLNRSDDVYYAFRDLAATKIYSTFGLSAGNGEALDGQVRAQMEAIAHERTSSSWGAVFNPSGSDPE